METEYLFSCFTGTPEKLCSCRVSSLGFEKSFSFFVSLSLSCHCFCYTLEEKPIRSMRQSCSILKMLKLSKIDTISKHLASRSWLLSQCTQWKRHKLITLVHVNTYQQYDFGYSFQINLTNTLSMHVFTFPCVTLMSLCVPVSMVLKNKIRVESCTCLPALAWPRAETLSRALWTPPVNALPWSQPNVSVTAVRVQELSSCGSTLMRLWVRAAGGRRLGTGQPHHSTAINQLWGRYMTCGPFTDPHLTA